MNTFFSPKDKKKDSSSEAWESSTPLRVGSTAPFSSSSASTKTPPYFRRNSVLYIIATISMMIGIILYCGITLIGVSRKFYPIVKVNLGKPFFILRWMGSQGVDLSDLQWYYLLVAIPPVIPIASVYLFFLRKARRSSVQKYLPLLKESRGGEDESVVTTTSGNGVSGLGFSSMGKANNMYHSNYVAGRDISKLQLLHLVGGILISIGISGPLCFYGFVLIALNFYCIAPLISKIGFKASMTVMWFIHVSVLFLNFHYKGYTFKWFGLSMLDTCMPVLIRWTVQYNMSLLRMIAFNNDYWEYYLLANSMGEKGENSNANKTYNPILAQRQKVIQKHERTCIDCAIIRERSNNNHLNNPEESLLCNKARTECVRAGEEYQSFLSYLAYLYYPPLFVAGPMISYNSYVSFCHFPSRRYNKKEITSYTIRTLGNAIFLFVFMHFFHIHAMIVTDPARSPEDQNVIKRAAKGNLMSPFTNSTQNTTTSTIHPTTTLIPLGKGVVNIYEKVMPQLDVPQRTMVFIFALAFLWLKFNVIWKMFRLAALVEGSEPPEDMPRCFANTVSIQGFWRDWHASFNLWIVRYMYIPMGGSRTKFISIFPIFFFIAVWHDVEMRLVYWAFYICICFLPEMVCTVVFSSKLPIIEKIKSKRTLYLVMRFIGTQMVMMELILINLVGFALGTEGVEKGVQAFKNTSIPFFCLVVYLFFCAAVLAVQDREQEVHDKLVLKNKYGLQSR